MLDSAARRDAWLANDSLFFEELKTGHRWTKEVGRRLASAGIPVRVSALTHRADLADRARYRDEVDLRAGPGRGQIIEVKSRKLRFSDDPMSYPKATAFVDTRSGWDAKRSPPCAVVLVSQQTGSMLVVPVRRTRSLWRVERKVDHVRGIEDSWYAVPRGALRPLSELIAWLRGLD